MNERISENYHLIGKLPKAIASHDSFQSPNIILYLIMFQATVQTGESVAGGSPWLVVTPGS